MCSCEQTHEAIRRLRQKEDRGLGEADPFPDLGRIRNIFNKDLGSRTHAVSCRAVSVHKDHQDSPLAACTVGIVAGWLRRTTPRSRPTQKRSGQRTISAIIPPTVETGLEERRAVLWTEASRRAGLTPNEFVAPTLTTVCENPEHSYHAQGAHPSRGGCGIIRRCDPQNQLRRIQPRTTIHSWITTVFEGFEVKARHAIPSVAASSSGPGAEFAAQPDHVNALWARPAFRRPTALSKWKELTAPKTDQTRSVDIPCGI